MVVDLKAINEIVKDEPHLVFSKATEKYLNPNTGWDNATLYFGMGGGSQELTKGLPVDVLGLLFTGELLKQKIGLKKASILVADVITKTNPFPEEDIDRVMKGERDMMQYLVELFKFQDWEVILHSDLHKKSDHPDYMSFLETACKNIDKAIENSPFRELGKDARGHEDNYHFALESTLTHYLAGNGIHLGWYIPNPNITCQKQVEYLIEKFGRSGLKRMDEEPFDSYYIELMKVLGEIDKVTPIYVKASFRIGENEEKNCDHVDRVPPYITYKPEKRVLLKDNDNLMNKLKDCNGRSLIPKKGGAKKYYRDIIRLSKKFGVNYSGTTFLDNFQQLMDYINSDKQLKKIYKKTFKD